jgi:hypothetical protein
LNVVWQRYGRRPNRAAAREAIEAALLRCGAEVEETRSRWVRCPVDADDERRNCDDAETVQAAQLKMQQMIEKSQRKGQAPFVRPSSASSLAAESPRPPNGLAAADSMAALPWPEAGSPEPQNQMGWLKLPLYKAPADRAQRLSAQDLGFLLGEVCPDPETSPYP